MTEIVIAKNTFKEIIRDRVLYIILIFGLGMMWFSSMLYFLSMRQDVKIMKDIGLGMISIFGIIITIFVGSNMLFKEIDKKTIYTVLSKPIPRTSFIVGKFIGLSSLVLLVTSFMTVAFYLVLLLKDIPFESLFILAIFFSYLEMIFLIAVTIFFSTITSPLITTFCTLVIFLVGRSTVAIKTFIDKLDPGLTQDVFSYVFYLIPNLEHVNIINQVVYGDSPDFIYSLTVTGYMLIYCILLLYISTLTFKYKDF